MGAGTGRRGWNVLWVLVLCTAALVAGPAARAVLPRAASLTSSAASTIAGELYQGGDARVHALDLRTLGQVWQSAQLGTDSTHGSVAVARGRIWSYTGDGRVVGIGSP